MSTDDESLVQLAFERAGTALAVFDTEGMLVQANESVVRHRHLAGRRLHAPRRSVAV